MARDTLLSGESKNIEYKVTLPDKSEKYMKTIVAFANTQGGKLIVGVDDKTHDFPEYSCAVTPQVRQTGNRLSGPAGTAYASLLT